MNQIPDKILVEQATTLPQTISAAFMCEQADRFHPLFDHTSSLEKQETNVALFLEAQLGTSKAEELMAMWFDSDSDAYNFLNAVNYKTESRAVAFIDDADYFDSSICVVINHTYENDGYTKWVEIVRENAA